MANLKQTWVAESLSPAAERQAQHVREENETLAMCQRTLGQDKAPALVRFQELRDAQARLLGQLLDKEGEVGAALDTIRDKSQTRGGLGANEAERDRLSTYRKWKRVVHQGAVDMRRFRVQKYIIKHEVRAVSCESCETCGRSVEHG